MGNMKSATELNMHKNNALKKVDTFISEMIDGNSTEKGKADKFSYWLEDYIQFLSYENDFKEKCSNRKLKKYKRGEIIKVHLGYNIGSEEGGLHYCVVIEKNNSVKNPVITVVPLTSQKPNIDVTNLKQGSISLGNELFTATSAKLGGLIKELQRRIGDFEVKLEPYKQEEEVPKELEEEFDSLEISLNYLQKTKREFDRMKNGSIALVNQITTISKLRIYDPKNSHDPLAGIKLSNEKLDKIDNEIIRRYTK